VASVVVAASGGVVANALAPFDPQLARSTVITSYIIWGTGVPPACLVMAVYFYRTAIGGVPAAAALSSVFLPLGPCGQGAYGMIVLGKMTRDLAYDYNLSFGLPLSQESTLRMADAVYAGGLVSGMILWGFGFLWYIVAFAIVLDHYIKHRNFFALSNFTVGLWAITFPIGVFATAADQIASEFSSPAFKVIATFLSVQVVIHWLYVSVMTVWKVIDGTIFVAPELAGFPNRTPPVRWASPVVDLEK
jgi:tellurite resistance protein TehA-like permease